MLADGSYDAFVVDAEDGEADGDSSAATSLVLTIVAGEHKGEVITVRATGLGRSSIDLLGMPATLLVADGVPSVTIDD
jgi:hypothetical protein